MTGLTRGSFAVYTCESGYQLSGERIRTCQSDQTWSGEAPTCTRMTVLCPALDNITNGHVLVSGHTPDSNATYSCVIGYVLNGTSSRTCQENGEWSGQEPTCEGISKWCHLFNFMSQHVQNVRPMYLKLRCFKHDEAHC